MLENTINDDKTIAGGSGTMLAGRYHILRQLGEGGMGSVWLAEDRQLDNRKVAIKMLPSIVVTDKRAYQQLKSEALVSLKLVHPNIVTLRAFEENNGAPYLVMDYIEGQTLSDYLAVKGKLSEAETIKLLKPIAAALDYAHGEKVIHRDVKPSNIIIRKDGQPFILDFGIAREIQESMTRVTGRTISGTLLYMSPEQLRGAPPSSAQDVYSFSAMVYECLNGAPPFTSGEIAYQILNEKPMLLAGRTQLIAAVMAGLSKMPDDRPNDCISVLAEEDTNIRHKGDKAVVARPLSRIKSLLGCIRLRHVVVVAGVITCIAVAYFCYAIFSPPDRLVQLSSATTAKDSKSFQLGVNYDKGLNGCKRDLQKAAYYYRAAANAGGCGEAYYNLGLMYEFGVGLERDIRYAARCYNEASKLGIAQAGDRWKKLKKKFKLDVAFLPSLDDPKPWPDARVLYNSSELLVFSDASGQRWDVPIASLEEFKEQRGSELCRWYCFKLSDGAYYTIPEDKKTEFENVFKDAQLMVLKSDGKGEIVEEEAMETKRNRAERTKAFVSAFENGKYEDAARLMNGIEQNDAENQYSIAWMYEQGKGVKEDLKSAIEWYQKAAKQGHVEAQHVLGKMYEQGRGVVKDEVEAERWYRKAAEQGKAIAQYDLGRINAQGHGSANNDAEAKKWLSKAFKGLLPMHLIYNMRDKRGDHDVIDTDMKEFLSATPEAERVARYRVKGCLVDVPASEYKEFSSLARAHECPVQPMWLIKFADNSNKYMTVSEIVEFLCLIERYEDKTDKDVRSVLEQVGESFLTAIGLLDGGGLDEGKLAAEWYRIVAKSQRSKVVQISDENGFKGQKDALSDVFDRAEACYDAKNQWKESAVLFTNYVARSKELLLLDGERRRIVEKRKVKNGDDSKGRTKTNLNAGDVKTVILPGGEPMKIRWCPPGVFLLGSSTSEIGRMVDELPLHIVDVEGFWIAETELTQRQWMSVMGNNPSEHKGYDLPVDSVSYDDCKKFIQQINAKKLGYMVFLPSDDQWEYACRAGTDIAIDEIDGFGWCGKNQVQHKVGTKKPNKWGLYDMNGNVWEYCDNQIRLPNNVSFSSQRGGSAGHDVKNCRAVSRRGIPKWGGLSSNGFRLCVDFEESTVKIKLTQDRQQ